MSLRRRSNLDLPVSPTTILIIAGAIVFGPKIKDALDNLIKEQRPETGGSGGQGGTLSSSQFRFVATSFPTVLGGGIFSFLFPPRLEFAWVVGHIGQGGTYVVGSDISYMNGNAPIQTIAADLSVSNDLAWTTYTVSASAPYTGMRPAALTVSSFIRGTSGGTMASQGESRGISVGLF